MHKDKVLEVVFGSLPLANQIKNLDTTSSPDAIRFDWRGTRYRVSDTLMVEEVKNGCLAHSDQAILMEALLKITKA